MTNGVVRGLGFWNILVGSVATVAGFGLVGVFWKLLPPEVPLWYSRPWGQAQLAGPAWLLVLPTITGVVVGGSVVIHRLLFETEPLLAAISSATSMVIAVLGTLGLFRILILVL